MTLLPTSLSVSNSPMPARKIIQKIFFRLKERVNTLFFSSLRKAWWRFQGMRIGRGTNVPRISITWPHQVWLGRNCVIEADTSFKFDGIWTPGPCLIFGDNCFVGRGCEFNIVRHLSVGDRTAIASGCKFIDHDHGITGKAIDETPGTEQPIRIGEDVWLGVNVIVLKGVDIGNSAVVAAGSVVTKSIPAGEIWAGVPARRIGARSVNP